MRIDRRELILNILASAALTVLPSEASSSEEVIRNGSPKSIEVPGRPRLYVNQLTIKELKRRFHNNAAWSFTLLEQGDQLLQEEFIPEEKAKLGGGQQASFAKPARQMEAMGLILGLLYIVTNDSQYADKLLQAMTYYGKYEKWGGPGLADRNPPWHSELDTADFCLGYACGYDMLHGYCSSEQKQKIASDLIRLGIRPTFEDWLLPPRRFHSLDSMGHNWWGVCVSGAGIACLALLGDNPQAKAWISKVDEGFVEWFSYQGNPLHNRTETFDMGGPSYEGVAYTNYAISSFLHYLYAWQQSFPGKDHPAFHRCRGISEFFLHTLYPTNGKPRTVNFGDSGLKEDFTETVLLLQACGLADEYTASYLRQMPKRDSGLFSYYLHEKTATLQSHSMPLVKVYPEIGWAIARSSWEKNASLLAIKSGYTWNHAHADASSFLLMHGGLPLIIDSGTCSYGDRRYTQYYRQSEAHNVVLFNGEGQPSSSLDVGTKFPGSILKSIGAASTNFFMADATGPMCHVFQRNYRSFLWIDDAILILDDIASYQDGALDWLLHTGEKADRITDHRLRIGKDLASLTFEMLYPDTLLSMRSGLTPYHPDKKLPYYAFTTTTRNNQQQFLSLINLDASANATVLVEKQENYLKIRLTQKKRHDLIFVNLRSIGGPLSLSSTIHLDHWSTDAYVVAFLDVNGTMPDNPAECQRYMVVDGSFLRCEEQVVLESLSKSDFLWGVDAVFNVQSRGQPHSSYSVYTNIALRAVTVNGTSVSFVHDAQNELVYLKH